MTQKFRVVREGHESATTGHHFRQGDVVVWHADGTEYDAEHGNYLCVEGSRLGLQQVLHNSDVEVIE